MSEDTCDKPLYAKLTLKWQNLVLGLKKCWYYNPSGSNAPSCHLVRSSWLLSRFWEWLRCCNLCALCEWHCCARQWNNCKNSRCSVKESDFNLSRTVRSSLTSQHVHYSLSQFSNALEIYSIHLWCYSTVTLSRVQTPLYRLKTYVSSCSNSRAYSCPLFASCV